MSLEDAKGCNSSNSSNSKAEGGDAERAKQKPKHAGPERGQGQVLKYLKYLRLGTRISNVRY